MSAAVVGVAVEGVWRGVAWSGRQRVYQGLGRVWERAGSVALIGLGLVWLGEQRSMVGGYGVGVLPADLLHIELYPYNTKESAHAFLLALRAKGYHPCLVQFVKRAR